MSGMLCIGGGVLLATVFVHMIPEVREQLELARKQGKEGVSPKNKIQRRVPSTGDIFKLWPMNFMIHRTKRYITLMICLVLIFFNQSLLVFDLNLQVTYQPKMIMITHMNMMSIVIRWPNW